MKKVSFLVISTILVLAGCKHPNEKKSNIMEVSINKVVDSLANKFGVGIKPMAEKGVRQVAKLWIDEDGALPCI